MGPDNGEYRLRRRLLARSRQGARARIYSRYLLKPNVRSSVVRFRAVCANRAPNGWHTQLNGKCSASLTFKCCLADENSAGVLDGCARGPGSSCSVSTREDCWRLVRRAIDHLVGGGELWHESK